MHAPTSRVRSLAGKVRRRLTLSHLLPAITAENRRLERRLDALDRRLRDVQQALGRVEARQTDDPVTPDLTAHEFRVTSQWGEDGILRHLCRHLNFVERTFVEFGVENYEEANTRFLLTDLNWSGLVLDGSQDHVGQIRRSRAYWMHDLRAAEAFITRDNINDLLTRHGMGGRIGLLSIDIDGMDYWVWQACTAIDPAVVVIEYNHRYGPSDRVVVPYDPSFDRRRAHHSLCYYGASLAALVSLGERKGYAFVGCNAHGLNAFFVRRDTLTPAVRDTTAEAGYVPGRFSEYHDGQGVRTKVPMEVERAAARSGPLIEVP